MKKSLHPAVVVMALAATTACVHATGTSYTYGDLLVGFDGGTQDFIYDLGAFSALSDGKTWSLGSNLGTRYGVVGASTMSTKHIYSTSFASDENAFSPFNTYNLTRPTVVTTAEIIVSGGSFKYLSAGESKTTTPSDTTGWTFETDQSAGTPGTTFQNNFFNPNVDVGSMAYFFDNDASSSSSGGTVTTAGYFFYDTAAGVLTYHRAVPSQTPPQPTLSINVTNSLDSLKVISAVSFISSNTVTYTLHFTNSDGLSQPISTWPALGTTIAGDGTTKTFLFTNSVTASNCFFSVGAQ